MKRTLYFISVVLVMFIFLPAVKAEDMEYTLFDTNIVVNKDRTIDVEETYHIYFINNTKQITRKINTNIEEIRPNKSSLLINSTISNISSKQKINIKKKSSIYDITMNINGKQDEIGEYKLKYKINLGKDTSKNYDELYYDIVSLLDANVSSLTFTIKLPDEIDSKKVKFSLNNKYNISKDDLEIEYNDNMISGTFNPLLESGKKLSVRMEFPNDYFIGTTDNFNYYTYLILIIPCILLLYIIYIWVIYGRKNSLSIRLAKDAPYKFDPAEVGYIYKGNVEEMDLVSLILHMANNGYLKIVENDDGYKLGKTNSFKFVKIKDYDGNNAAQKIIFERLFQNNDVAELEGIEYHFSEQLLAAKNMLENRENHKRIYFTDLNFKRFCYLILIAISIFIINFKPINILTNTYYLPFVLSALLVFCAYVIFISNTPKLVKFIFGILPICVITYFEVTSILNQPLLLGIFIRAIVIIFISLLFFEKLSDRTKFGNKVLGDIYGFKMYLDKMTDQEMKERLEKNPNFYYDMIPYTYVFDSFDMWIKKGLGVVDNPPSWYIGVEEFKLRNFEDFIKNVIYTTTMVMIKRTYNAINEDTLSQKVKTNLND